VAALHQGAPGQMTWLEDPSPGSALPIVFLALVMCEQKIKILPYLTALFVLF